jgi:hypothetical protein
MTTETTLNWQADISARVSMGSLTLGQRLKLIWFVITGTVVTFSGNCLLSTTAKYPKPLDTVRS